MLLLHCGLPRTSTSIFQSTLFRHRDLLAGAGLVYPDRWRERKEGAHHGIERLLDPGPESEDARADFTSFLAAHGEDRVLLSAENLTRFLLSEHGLDAALGFLATAGETTPVRCLWTLRRLDEVLASAYFLTLGFANSGSLPLSDYIADASFPSALFAAMQRLEQGSGNEAAYVKYDPAGGHNGELLRVAGVPAELVALIQAEIDSTRRRNASFTHKQAVALASLGALSDQVGVELDAMAVRGAFTAGEFEFGEDWPFRPVGEEAARAVHERALAAARESGFAPYVQFFAEDEVEVPSPAGLDLDVLTAEDLRLFAAHFGAAPPARRTSPPAGADSGPLAAEIRRRLGPPPELPHWPLVSIVVLNRDGAGLLRRLLEGLVERTDYPNLELILVDNASSDDSLELIRAVEAPFPISIVANHHNESFADGCNQGAALATGELLLFLNNDADPFEPGWLRELVACLHGSGAAAAGPTLIEPVRDGGAGPDRYAIHQRGLTASESEGVLVPAYRDRGADPLGETLGEDVETITIAAAALLIQRGAFDEVGGFTHGYWYGPEDVDLGLKLRERGMRALCSGRSLLIHPPNSTLDAIDAELRGEWVRGNRRLFAQRWGARGRREFELDRLRGGGLWAAPGSVADAPPAHTQAEVEALGFCLQADGIDAHGPAARAEASLDAIGAALRRRGHRCLVVRGMEIEGLAALEYDVAVHLRGSSRYVLNPAQLNVLWSSGDSSTLDPIERSRYDLTVSEDLDGPAEEIERFAERLVAVVGEHAAASGFKARIEPGEADRR